MVRSGLYLHWLGNSLHGYGCDGGGRPAVAFLGAQVFNVIWTLLLAYLLFGGIVFPVPETKYG